MDPRRYPSPPEPSHARATRITPLLSEPSGSACCKVSLTLFLASMLALCSSSASTVSVWPFNAARCRGVCSFCSAQGSTSAAGAIRGPQCSTHAMPALPPEAHISMVHAASGQSQCRSHAATHDGIAMHHHTHDQDVRIPHSPIGTTLTSTATLALQLLAGIVLLLRPHAAAAATIITTDIAPAWVCAP